MEAELEPPFHPQEQRWRARLSWRLLPTFVATGLAGGGVAWLSASNTLVMVIGVLAVIQLYAWVVYRVWRARVVLTGTSNVADTVVVQGWFADRRVPVDQIMEVVSDVRYGPRIRMIDGREIGFLPLSGGLTSKSRAREREMVEAINRAVGAAHASHPEEAAAAVQANAPLRTRRELRSFVELSVIGLGMLLLGLTSPHRWHAIPLDVIGGWSLLFGLAFLFLNLFLSKGRGKHSRH